MEVTDDVVAAMFATWRADIDSVSFAHEARCDEIVRGLLGDGPAQSAKDDRAE